MANALLLEPDLTGSEPLSELAYRELRRLIVTLELAPGSPVSEAELCERLGLGRTPIREAVRALAAERLIDVYPRRGTFVADVDPRQLSAIAEVREELEPFAARLAAKRRTIDDIAVIDALIADIDAAEPAMRSLIELDQRIHRHVYRCAHNEVLASLCEGEYAHALRIWFLALERTTRLEHAMAENRELLLAIREGDHERASSVMSAHITGFEHDIQQAI